VTVTEAGSVKLCDVATPAAGGTQPGRSITSVPLRLDYMGGRLAELGKLYGRWKFGSAVLRYVPAVSSNTDGSLVVFYSQDSDETYTTNEAVGAANAASAVDNMEFSVREKMNMKLHLPGQLLFTTSTYAEKTWHTAGVVNVVSNGALVNSKVYGSLYLDFTVILSQPCAPFDVRAPLVVVSDPVFPSGLGARGTTNSPLIDWVGDAARMLSFYGHSWITDPNSGQVSTDGRIYVPPGVSVALSFSALDTGASGVGIGVGVSDPLLVVMSTGNSNQSTDKTLKEYNALLSNTSPSPQSFQILSGGAGYALNSGRLTLVQVPYTT